MRFIDARGRSAGCVDILAFQRASGRRDIEIPRGDLAAILRRACEGRVRMVDGDHIVSLTQDEAGVDVSLARAGEQRFDLVIGADGLHSGVRQLAFGPEGQFVRHAGLYVATLPVADAGDGSAVTMYCEPGRAVAIHPVRGQAMAAFIWHSAPVPGFDHRDPVQHRHILATAYAGAGWRVPELLAQSREAEDLHFDAVSIVDLPQWSKGRVGLVGDAASCLSLFGDGSTLAMAGGHALADALAAMPDQPAMAFARFEATHRTLVAPKLKGLRAGAAMLVPKTSAGLAMRNLAARLLPMATAIGRVGSLVSQRHAA